VFACLANTRAEVPKYLYHSAISHFFFFVLLQSRQPQYLKATSHTLIILLHNYIKIIKTFKIISHRENRWKISVRALYLVGRLPGDSRVELIGQVISGRMNRERGEQKNFSDVVVKHHLNDSTYS